MNKSNLFLIMGMAIVFATGSIFGSIMTPALAQGNDTGDVEVGLAAAPPANVNMSMTMNNMSNATTATEGALALNEQPIDTTTQSEDSGDSGSEDSGSEDSGENEN